MDMAWGCVELFLIYPCIVLFWGGSPPNKAGSSWHPQKYPPRILDAIWQIPLGQSHSESL